MAKTRRTTSPSPSLLHRLSHHCSLSVTYSPSIIIIISPCPSPAKPHYITTMTISIIKYLPIPLPSSLPHPSSPSPSQVSSYPYIRRQVACPPARLPAQTRTEARRHEGNTPKTTNRPDQCPGCRSAPPAYHHGSQTINIFTCTYVHVNMYLCTYNSSERPQ
ncbi:hypothetical protein BKA80DRAFT_97678 [Phyllosticta citrichinensis]